MGNYVYCWHFKDDFLAGQWANEVEFITDFNMSDQNINDTYSCFEIISVYRAEYETYWLRIPGSQYVIDNTLRFKV